MINKNLQIGSKIKGKWNKNEYKIICLLGAGGIGKVYKVLDIKTNEIWALKISDDLHSITKEYEMLNCFCHIGLVPKIKEIDDFCCGKDKLHYLVIEYIEGKNLKEYIKDQPVSIKASIGLGLLIGKSFQPLHKNGYVFGDLKLENLMIDKKNNLIKIIDLGGVTSIGSSIKEFTPLYDRASWNMGLRRGDEKYDLFALSMLMTTLLVKQNFSPQETTVDHIVKKLKVMHISSKLTHLIHNGLMQKEISFEEFMIQLEIIYKNRLYEGKGLKKIKFDQKNTTINMVLMSSILLFLFTMYKYVGKSIWF